MRAFLRSGFTWRLVGGFVLGALGVVGFHTANVAAASAPHAFAVHRGL